MRPLAAAMLTKVRAHARGVMRYRRMDKIILFMNRLTDLDWGWWPLLKYRPKKTDRIDLRVVAKITPFFGTLVGLLVILLTGAYNNILNVTYSIVLSWVVFLVFYRVTFAVTWNIRAKRINHGNGQSA